MLSGFDSGLAGWTGAGGSVSHIASGCNGGVTPALWSGNLAAALANTTAITLTLEFNNAIVESAGLDNFQITPVPEPTTAWLFGVGGLAMWWRARQAAQARG